MQGFPGVIFGHLPGLSPGFTGFPDLGLARLLGAQGAAVSLSFLGLETHTADGADFLLAAIPPPLALDRDFLLWREDERSPPSPLREGRCVRNPNCPPLLQEAGQSPFPINAYNCCAHIRPPSP
jgi:hypothetical protein